MANILSFPVDDSLRERIERAAEKMNMQIDETIIELLELSLEGVLGERTISMDVSPELFLAIGEVCKMDVKEQHESGLIDGFWQSEPEKEKEILKKMRERREGKMK